MKLLIVVLCLIQIDVILGKQESPSSAFITTLAKQGQAGIIGKLLNAKIRLSKRLYKLIIKQNRPTQAHLLHCGPIKHEKMTNQRSA